MRGYEKKKAYRLHCKKQVRAGLINNDKGEWVDPAKWMVNGVTIGDTTMQMVRAGNRVANR